MGRCYNGEGHLEMRAFQRYRKNGRGCTRAVKKITLGHLERKKNGLSTFYIRKAEPGKYEFEEADLLQDLKRQFSLTLQQVYSCNKIF